MELIFFGTTGAITTADNNNVSLAVVHDNHAAMVDTSATPYQSLLRVGIGASKLDALILTHAHPDHMYALPSLIQSLSLVKREKPLKIFCNRDTEKRARKLLDIFDLSPSKVAFPIEWMSAETDSMDCIPGVSLQLFPVNHSIRTSGVKLSAASSSLVFTSDTAPAKRIVSEATGATALIHESTGSDKYRKLLNPDGHSSALQAGAAAEKAGVATLFLCHFNFELDISPEALQAEAKTAFGGQVIIPELFKVYLI